MSGTPTTAAAHIVEWMVEQALATTTVADSFKGYIDHLRNEGFVVDRAHLAYTTLHPLHRGAGATWTVEDGMKTEGYAFDRDQEASGWYESPIHFAVKNRTARLRRRLAGPAAMVDFPILKTFAAEGYTDYLLLCCPFESFYAPVDIKGADQVHQTNEGSGLAISFTTKRPGGFTDDEVAAMHWLLKPFATVVKMADQRQIALNLAECYIGREAGPRVLGGAIQRGDFASTSAVVWLSDLRASTEMSASMPREEYIATINEFFDCTAGAVDEEGGEPLTFIGDGALAIFPVERLGEAGARAAALRAADRADKAMQALNADRRTAGRQELDWGVALHAGLLEYGNIGSPARHSWSVIGAVVNETARLEGLTKVTGERVVLSEAFVADAPDGDWRDLGAFDLRGVREPFKVFAPAHSATAPQQEETA